MYLAAQKILNYKNIEEISIEKINFLSKMYPNDYLEYYKASVFMRWFNENIENNLGFLKKARKLQKRLSINLSYHQENKLYDIEPRDFTKHRAMKTIEVPYKKELLTNNLQKDAFFFYKNIRTYEKGITFLEKKYIGEIYMTKKEIVLYDHFDKKIQKIINYKKIRSIKLKSYYIQLKIENEPDIFFRYFDNILIYISLSRVVKKKIIKNFENESKENSIKIEETIETILNIKND
ncbi:MAG: hypothetical protein TYPL_4670 [Candidatus Tyloplasma litorale]|nr:MAG: hypothetical protein TYPL_4670 [Mycoplasmatales bacterium]